MKSALKFLGQINCAIRSSLISAAPLHREAFNISIFRSCFDILHAASRGVRQKPACTRSTHTAKKLLPLIWTNWIGPLTRRGSVTTSSTDCLSCSPLGIGGVCRGCLQKMYICDYVIGINDSFKSEAQVQNLFLF